MQDEEQGHGSTSCFDCFLVCRISNQFENSSESIRMKNIANKNKNEKPGRMDWSTY